MKHLLFIPPFVWEKEFETLNLDSKTVAWLMALPISEAEYSYALSKGSDALETAFEETQIDWYNIDRASVF